MEKKRPQKEQKDESTAKLQGIYRRKCDQNGVIQVKAFKQKLEAVAEQGKLECVKQIIDLQMWQEIGPVSTRAIMDTFTEIGYKHLKKLRLWKIKTEDEGLRAICNYIEKSQTIEYLDLLDNDITPLGCQFLGRILIGASPIVKLKLDHNCFGTQGLKNLAIGLSRNSVLEKLSLKYCNIDQGGSKYIQQMLANFNGKLKSVKLQGNPLKNPGVFEILRAVQLNETLQKLKIPDVQLNLLFQQQPTEEQLRVASKLLQILQSNKNIYSYDLRFNQISDNVAHKIAMKVQANTSIVKMQLSETVAQEIRELVAQSLKKRKVGKKGKKKKSPSPKKKK